MYIIESTYELFTMGSVLMYHLIFSSGKAISNAIFNRDFREIEMLGLGIYYLLTFPFRGNYNVRV